MRQANDKRLCAWILVIAAALALWGCREKGRTSSDAPDPAVSDAGGGKESIVTADDGTRWLTHVYKPRDMEIPDGWEFNENGIEYSAERDEFRGRLSRSEEIEDEGGVIYLIFDWAIAVWDGQGNVKTVLQLNDPDHRWRSVGQSCFDGNRMYAVMWEYDGKTSFGAWDTGSGELLVEKAAEEIPSWDPMFSVRELTADGKGNLYVSNGKTVTVFSSDFVFLNEFKASTFDMAKTPDGEVWAVCPDMAGRGLFRLDPENGREKLTYLDAAAAQIAFLPAKDGNGWNVIAAVSTGINRFTQADEGKWPSEELMSFANSGVTYNSDVDVQLDTERLRAALSSERFLLVSRERIGEDLYASVPRIYEKAPDIDLTAIRTVTLAFSNPLPDNIRFQISRFNRENDGIRITMLDYTSYNNEMNREGGNFRLTTDILNGLVHPDLVYGEWRYDPVKTLMQKGVTVDLGAYLDADPEVNRETIAGCILNVFDDGQGGVWGIAPFFQIRTLIGLKSVLGDYADGWDLDGFLDFADSLPADAILSTNATVGGWGGIEMDYSQFIGEDACRFDSPVFIRYLEWLKALPTSAELQQRSPAVSLYPETLAREYYQNGSVALRSFSAEDTDALLLISDLFGQEPVAVPGNPMTEGSGTVVETTRVFVIPPNAPDPDAAWAFIRSVLLADDLSDEMRWHVPSGIPAYLPTFEKECGKCLRSLKTYTANGIMGVYPDRTVEEVEQLMALYSPGISYEVFPYCTEEDVTAVRELIRTAGNPYRTRIPNEVRDIVTEEISAFLSGVGTAESCAAKIQSRVSIWLAEHR